MRRVSIMVAALLCAACTGTAPDAAPSAGSEHNQADVDFVAALIPHHRAGIALARRVAERPEHRVLAEAIVSTERDEVTRMNGWLSAWGVPAPATSGPSATPERDPAEALAAHQEEAIVLAQREQAKGSNPDALAFAKQIVESRTAEASALRSAQ